ncbi:MAG: hypothetical protein ACOX2N_01620 [Peptococcia bacterium]
MRLTGRQNQPESGQGGTVEGGLLSPESSTSLFWMKHGTGNLLFLPHRKYAVPFNVPLRSAAKQTYEDEVEKAMRLTGRQNQPESGQGGTVEGGLLSPESSTSLFWMKHGTGNGTAYFPYRRLAAGIKNLVGSVGCPFTETLKKS